MRLTPLDIRKQEFSRGIRGYEADEVDAFLQMVSEQWEELLDDVRRKGEEVRDLEAKLQHYEKVEEALQEALQTARESSKKSIENAEQKASLLIEKAEARAQEIRYEAEVERHQLKRETAKLTDRRSEIVTRLRAFLASELELLANYEGDDPMGFIKPMPAGTQRSEPPKPQQTSRATAAAEARDQAPAAVPDESPSEGSYRDEQTGGEAASAREPDSAAQEVGTDADDDIPSDVTAAEHAQQTRHFPGNLGPGSEAPAQDSDEADEAGQDPEWTTQTYVSGSADEHRPGQEESGEEGPTDTDEEADLRASSEEIEKIRRILSDLD